MTFQQHMVACLDQQFALSIAFFCLVLAAAAASYGPQTPRPLPPPLLVLLAILSPPPPPSPVPARRGFLPLPDDVACEVAWLCKVSGISQLSPYCSRCPSSPCSSSPARLPLCLPRRFPLVFDRVVMDIGACKGGVQKQLLISEAGSWSSSESLGPIER